ncbi:hypothetical protein [Asticcacaulis sp. YBE204]|uniref:hypothetical protein n=1 Tax=Asticcacaulis sp. YBE204 TaxID=1282363 RepID=UPI0003C40689|nr:hypothetical protein [Asticcacaulis sp. YBE204]ESQ80459.1 hypothetical protein AEYBE204_04110 [Asticcacaulis sp. YBE204]
MSQLSVSFQQAASRLTTRNAINWLEHQPVAAHGLGWLIALFTLPLSSGLVGRIIKDRPWLVDYDAYACAADTVGKGLSPYSLTPFCDGMNATPYVYAPQIAQVMAPVVETLGHDLSKTLYLLILGAALTFIGWAGMIRAFPKASPLLRIPVYAVLTGSSIASGNIGIILHALILLTAFDLDRRRWPFVAAVIFGALFKPTLLTCLLVLLYQNRPLKDRILGGAVSGVLGVGAYVLLMKTAGGLSDDWRTSLQQIVMTDQPGIGFFSWMAWFDLTAQSPVAVALAAVHTALIAGAGFLMVQFGRLTNMERIIFGLGVAQLVNPRLMDYDILYIAPCLVIMVSLCRQAGRRWYNALSWVLLALCSLILFINLWDANALPIIPMSGLAFEMVMLFSCGLLLWVRRHRFMQTVRDIPLPAFRPPVPVTAAE